MTPSYLAMILLGLVALGGCSTDASENATPGVTTERATNAADGAGSRSINHPKEETRQRNRRLLYLENGLEQWMDADLHQEYDRRDSMASLLHTYTADHLPQVVQDLRTGSPRRRRAMSGTLGFSGKVEAVAPLMDALHDQYYEVVLHSLASLYHLAGARTPRGDKIHIPIDPKPIIAFLSHPRAEVRGNAALALSRILNRDSPREFLVPLVAAASDSDKPTRVHAVAAIGSMRRHEGIPYLITALQDDVPLVRVRAALGLALVDDRDGVSALISVLQRKAETEDVRKAAARALTEILDEDFTLDVEVWIKRARDAGVPGF